MIVIDDLMPESDAIQPVMTEKYRVGDLNDSSNDRIIEGWANAMDEAEHIATQFEDQLFVGVWQDVTGNLVAIFDGIDWFTK